MPHQSTHLFREVHLQDDLRAERCLSAPRFGPRIVFFSGGSALNDISRRLKAYTHNSAHLITPFDSGGSSGILRTTFDMPAVGDLRSRLMALADETELGQPEIYALFSYRLPTDQKPKYLWKELESFSNGEHELISDISQPMRMIIQGLLQKFCDISHGDFDLRGASIGNLVLTGGYFLNERLLEPTLYLMSKMVNVLGTVRAVVDSNLHIGVELADGTIIHGQKAITGKEVAPLTCEIKRIFLSDGSSEVPRKHAPLPKRNRKLIERADMICYPPGSLYSSVLANLLPRGTGEAIIQRQVPKIYIPSLGRDPECLEKSLCQQITALIDVAAQDVKPTLPASQVVTHVLCDDSISKDMCLEAEQKFGIKTIRAKLHDQHAPTKYDPDKICRALMAFG